MPQYFLDSSALVKRYRQESGTVRIRELVDRADRLVISRLAHIETAAAIIRRGRGDAVPLERIASTLDDLDEDVQLLFELVEMDDVVLAQAQVVIRRHGLRAADAIQLASAMAAQPAAGEALVLVAADQELNMAAAAEGLAVIDPTQP